MISTDQFAHSDPTDIYKQMRPDQWTAIANEFVRVLKIAGDSQADRFAGVAAADGRQTTSTPVLKTLDQAVAVHAYTRDHYPDLFAEVARHPVTVASLRTPGTAAEADVAEEKDDAYERAASVNSAVDMDIFTPEASAHTPSMGYPEATAGALEPPHEGGSPPHQGQPGILREPTDGGSEDDTW
ncbi:MAG: hypothetical protein ACXVDA_09800 [Ktedonobacterales bacterium]